METFRAAKRGAAPQHWFLQKIFIKKLRRVINKVVEKQLRAHKKFFWGGLGAQLGPHKHIFVYGSGNTDEKNRPAGYRYLLGLKKPSRQRSLVSPAVSWNVWSRRDLRR